MTSIEVNLQVVPQIRRNVVKGTMVLGEKSLREALNEQRVAEEPEQKAAASPGLRDASLERNRSHDNRSHSGRDDSPTRS